MSEQPGGRAAFRYKSAEIAVALILIALGALIAFDSLRIGARWIADGPQTGYFPLYIALILCIVSAVNVVRALRIKPEANRSFVQVGQLRLVLSVLVPAAVFVGVISWTGLYLAATLFIAFFMYRLGGYPWWKAASGGVGAGVVLFVLFEIWFLVPLPKGPLERALGVG